MASKASKPSALSLAKRSIDGQMIPTSHRSQLVWAEGWEVDCYMSRHVWLQLPSQKEVASLTQWNSSALRGGAGSVVLRTVGGAGRILRRRVEN